VIIVIIGIDGMSGSGKTTYAKSLAAAFNGRRPTAEGGLDGTVAVIHIDDFYDCSAGKLKTDEIRQKFRELKSETIIIEGVYCLDSRKFDFDYTLRIFMEVSAEEQRKRIKARNPELYEMYINKWIPAENTYFKEQQIKQKCDFVHEAKEAGFPCPAEVDESRACRGLKETVKELQLRLTGVKGANHE
jgi:uridine kinase